MREERGERRERGRERERGRGRGRGRERERKKAGVWSNASVREGDAVGCARKAVASVARAATDNT